MNFGSISPTAFWIIAMIVFLAVEALTVGLTSIWFAVGSLAALVCATLNAQGWIQFVVFLVVSAAALYFTRPLAKKYINGRKEPTNADMIIGKECRVTETIDNIEGIGAVHVDGKIWTARSEDDEIIEKGTLVSALRIEGVKLIVKKTKESIQQK